MFKPLLGNSVVASDGAFWAHSRALFRPYFNKENVNNFDHTEDAIKGVIDTLESGSTGTSGWTSEKELMPLMLDFTLETGTGFLFGKPVKSSRAILDEDPEEEAILHQFREDFEAAEHYLNIRIRLQSLYWLADGPKLRRTMSRIRAFTERFVDVAVAHVQETADDASSTQEPKRYDLLTALATQTQDRTELRDQVFAILSASRDSTAALLAWTFRRLALHPEMFKQLRTTILETFAPDDPLSVSALKECRPLQHFLSEVLRLHGSVPVNNRRAVRDTVLPVGGGPDQKSPVAVKKGTIIFYSTYHMHRRADLWEDALEFKPERFQQSVTPWTYIPFSGGPRICIGQQFALTEVAAMIVRVMQQYDAIEPVDRAEMLRERKGIGLIMWPSEGVKVRFHRA